MLVFPPEKILEIAHHDPIVKEVVDGWRRGELSWSEAMQTAVVVLYQIKENHARRLARYPTPLSFEVNEAEFLKR